MKDDRFRASVDIVGEVTQAAIKDKDAFLQRQVDTKSNLGKVLDALYLAKAQLLGFLVLTIRLTTEEFDTLQAAIVRAAAKSSRRRLSAEVFGPPAIVGQVGPKPKPKP